MRGGNSRAELYCGGKNWQPSRVYLDRGRNAAVRSHRNPRVIHQPMARMDDVRSVRFSLWAADSSPKQPHLPQSYEGPGVFVCVCVCVCVCVFRTFPLSHSFPHRKLISPRGEQVDIANFEDPFLANDSYDRWSKYSASYRDPDRGASSRRDRWGN